MDKEFDWEPESELYDGTRTLGARVLAYAVGIALLCVFVMAACTVAARVDDPGKSTPWSSALNQALRDLNDGSGGQ